jgi:cysteine desulfurase/selenocysteine lyase
MVFFSIANIIPSLLSLTFVVFMREHFPYFEYQTPDKGASELPIYLDSAATTHKLSTVIKRTSDFYTHEYATVNRSSYPLANRVSQQYENVRALTASFINANTSDNIIFTSGATQSINYIANGLHSKMLNGNKIVVLASEHHANLLPWQQVCKKYEMKLSIIQLADNGKWTESQENELLAEIDESTAIVAMAHVSNLLGNIYPIQKACQQAKQVNALSVIDGTQAVAHLKIDVQAIDCDCYVFSAHKMYGPTGLGILYCKSSVAEDLNPSQFGGEMITDASFHSFELQTAPLKFETGTGNLAAILGFAPAIEFVNQNIDQIIQHEKSLYQYALNKIQLLDKIELIGNQQNVVGIISFCVKERATMDIANALYQQNIACRAGMHCAIPLLKSLGVDDCLRISLACYNNKADIDAFINALKVAINLQDEGELVHHELDETSSLRDSIVLPIASQVTAAGTWDQKYRQLLLASRHLNNASSAQCTTESEVMGCETQVWITKDSEGYKAVAKSKIIKGILTVLFEKAETIKKEDLVAFDFIEYLSDLGLVKYFSQGRKDGVSNAIKRIKELV